MGTLQLFSKEFALGFIGMMIGTGYLAQAIKSIPPIARYFKIRRKFCGMMCALTAGWLANTRSAARLRFPSSATATKLRN